MRSFARLNYVDLQKCCRQWARLSTMCSYAIRCLYEAIKVMRCDGSVGDGSRQ